MSKQKKDDTLSITYKRPPERIKIENHDLKLIFKTLNEIGYRLQDIDLIIKEDSGSKSPFNKAYYQNSTITMKNFQNLKGLLKNKLGKNILIELFGFDDIPHTIKIGYSNDEKIILPKNEKVAEFIGIMLGDGHLDKDGSKLSITLNAIDEEKYIIYVKEEILETLFKKYSFYKEDLVSDQGNKAIRYSLSSKSVHYALVNLGLIPGNKVENQVDVPNWIFEKREFIKKSLKGLFDTDGSLTVKKGGIIGITFTSGSKPLIDSFYKMCYLIGIKPEARPRMSKKRGTWTFSFYNKKLVRKFLEDIRPEKFNEPARLLWIGSKLIYYNSPFKIKNAIQKKIKKWKELNKKKIFLYSKSKAEMLRDWIEFEYNDFLANYHREDQFYLMTREIKLFLREDYEDFFVKESDDSPLQSKRIFKRKNKYIITIPTIFNSIKIALRENAYGGVVLKLQEDKFTFRSEYRVYNISPSIRNDICYYLYKTLKELTLDNDDVLRELIFEYIKHNYSNIYNSLKSLRYNIALIDYFIAVIRVIHEFLNRTHLDIDKKLGGYSIADYLNKRCKLPFSRNIVQDIVNFLKNKISL